MEASESRANAVVIRVRADVDQGLRSLERRGFGRGSGILSDGMSSFEDTINTEVSVDRSLSTSPSRDWAGIQFVLLGRRLLAVECLLSVLFRRSSSRGTWLFLVSDGRAVNRRFEPLSYLSEDSSNFELPPSTIEVTSAFAGDGSPSSSADPEDRLRI